MLLDGPSGVLVRAAPARDRRFLIAGRQVRAEGNELRGAVVIEAAGLELEVTPALGVAANVTASPFALRRERVGPAGLLLETIFTPVLGAAAVMQWVSPGGAAATAVASHWILRDGRASGDRTGSETAPASGRLSTGDSELRVIEMTSGVAILMTVSDPPTMIFAAGATRDAAEKELQKLRSFAALERRAALIPSDWKRDFLSIETGDPEIDEAFEWAKVRVRTATPSWSFWEALGALTVGFERPIEDLLKSWPASASDGGGASPELSLLAARFAQWNARGPLSSGGGRGADPVERQAVEALRSTLASASGGPSATGARRLPVLGRSAVAGNAEPRLEGLALGQTPDDDGDRAYQVVANALREGLAAGGLWPESRAAVACAALLFGVLGAKADVPVGRLRLAPRVPSSWSDVRVSGIRVEDALVRLDYRRIPAGHEFDLLQYSGRMPLMLVFEPEVSQPDGAPLRALIDGAPAELDIEARGGRVRTRVQLPLDAERRVSLVAE
jgi:hypothetical protein